MPDLAFKIGQTIETQDKRVGTIRYIGSLHIAAGEWLGLELADNTGKNDGSVKGERYFECPPGYGIFVRKESAVRIVKQPQPQPQLAKPTVAATNGSLSKPRPSSGITTDVAKKRQSLMGGGSTSTVGSRLSLRSPTKSPTKQAPPSISSATSTPRTGTPATTARTSDTSAKSRTSINGKSLMGPPSATAKPSTTASNRASVGGSIKPTSKPGPIPSRQALAGPRLSVSARGASQPVKNEKEEDIRADLPSPPAQEEDHDFQDVSHDEIPFQQPKTSSSHEETQSLSARSRQNTLTQDAANAGHEERARQAHVIKQLETKIRSLQKQRQEDSTQLDEVQSLRTQSSRYEGIIQTLQKKLKTNQQEITELKAKYEEAESRVQSVPERSAEQESELELATLDKELAEERADIFEAELEALKLKCEELELEAEILREEKLELASVMTPEERAGSGVLHLNQEIDRLRHALILLRDVSQEREADLKAENKELQESLDEKQQMASKFEETAAKFSRAQDTIQHLREQLDVAESNDEIVETLAAERDHGLKVIESLKRQIQDYEEHLQVTDELEAFHVEEEKRLHHQLDETEALLNERERQSQERQKVVEDLEYTLNKFRDVVQVLQNDIDELRRSRDMTELEAHEMSSKSRAMMDLNLRLQSSAAKTQVKAIDVELGKMRAEQASLHLEIVQLFVPDTFDADKQPIIGLLCFMRIKAKALLSKNILNEKMRDRPDFAQDDPSSIFAVMERMNHIAHLCDKFVQYMSSCSSSSFMTFGGAPFELQPVEQAVTIWVEALRRDELGHDGPEHLQRMADILTDMAEKLIVENQGTKATDLLASTSMIETHADHFATQIHLLLKMVQTKLGPPTDEDNSSFMFDKKMDQFAIKARTIKYISSKIIQSLTELRVRSMCPGEVTWSLFEEAEQISRTLAETIRGLCQAVVDDLNKPDRDSPPTYSSIIDIMTAAASLQQGENQEQASNLEDVFSILAKPLQSLQNKVDDLNNKSGDISSAFEFETSPAPWTVRAKEIKNQKVLSQDLQDELTRMKQKIQEQTVRIAERDRQLEERQVKIELLESRAKETKARDDGVKAMRTEIENLQAEKNNALDNLQRLQAEYQALSTTQEVQKAELEALKLDKIAHGQGTTSGVVDESISLRIKAEADLLREEVTTLQAAIRFLKQENQSLRIPVTDFGVDVGIHSWLSPNLLKQSITAKTTQVQQLQAESKDVFTDLMLLAKSSKPVKLKPRLIPTSQDNGKKSSWRPETDTTLYKVLQHKEELERWNESKLDLVKKARFLKSTVRRRHVGDVERLRSSDGFYTVGNKKPFVLDEQILDLDNVSSVVDGIGIVR